MTTKTQSKTQSNVKSEMCHFSVHGDFLTNHCRNLVVEGDWTHALNTLTESLIGISVEYCYQILKGEKKLVGINDVDLVDDDMESDEVKKYLSEVNYMYGSVVRIGSGDRKWFKPYAYVNNVGWADMMNVKESLGNCPSLKNTFSSTLTEQRVTYYMDDKVNDKSFGVSKLSKEFINNFVTPIAFLFGSCDAPPIWMPVNRSPEESILNCIKYGINLEDRGAKQYGCADCPDDWKKQEPKMTKTDSVLDHSESSKTGISLNELSKTGMSLPVILPEHEHAPIIPFIPSKPEEDLKFNFECGWILPDGRFFGCLYEGHRDLAEALLYHYCDIKLEDIIDGARMAEEKNWCRIQVGIVGREPMFSFKDYVNPRVQNVLRTPFLIIVKNGKWNFLRGNLEK